MGGRYAIAFLSMLLLGRQASQRHQVCIKLGTTLQYVHIVKHRSILSEKESV